MPPIHGPSVLIVLRGSALCSGGCSAWRRAVFARAAVTRRFPLSGGKFDLAAEVADQRQSPLCPRRCAATDLVGYRLWVIGLNGTGDTIRNSPYTEEALTHILENGSALNVQDSNFRPDNNLPLYSSRHFCRLRTRRLTH